MQVRGALLIVGAVVLAVAAWPAFINSRIDVVRATSRATPAPVPHDYEQREALIAFWEGAVRERHLDDMLSPCQLAAQYLARYREKGDIDDVLRARNMAERSLAVEPQNTAAIGEMVTALLTLHQFRGALRYADELVSYDPTNAAFLSQKASLEMELGEYDAADKSLRSVGAAGRGSVPAETVRSRYDELTGHLDRARELLEDATAQVDAHVDAPAQSRAWYHFRAGELAYDAGDMAAAIRDEQDALDLFPSYNLALKDLAKFELAIHADRAALAAATAGVKVTPFAETLGYQADAQAALGDADGATTTREVIFAIERIGNALRVNDRLLAVYYSDHGLRPADALAIARREARLRGDEIYAQDTLAWAAAKAGRWSEARQAAIRATRFDTEDPSVQYHAGIIALHTGYRDEAIRRLRRALELNAHFHPVYADDARTTLARLEAFETPGMYGS